MTRLNSNNETIKLEDDGRYIDTDIYFNRYYARKACRGNDVTVKVDSGYKNFSPSEYVGCRREMYANRNTGNQYKRGDK